MKKITYAEAAYILNYKKTHIIEKYLCKHELNVDMTEGTITCDVKKWAYIVTYPILVIFAFLTCLYDGGLKEFEVEGRRVYSWHECNFKHDFESRYDRMKNVFEGEN